MLLGTRQLSLEFYLKQVIGWKKDQRDAAEDRDLQDELAKCFTLSSNQRVCPYRERGRILVEVTQKGCTDHRNLKTRAKHIRCHNETTTKAR